MLERKKTTNNITESVASKPGTEEDEVQPPEKIINDDVSRKHKKTINNITESIASKPGTEEGEVVGANKSQSSAGDSFWSNAIATSFHDLLKLKISKLYEVLGVSYSFMLCLLEADNILGFVFTSLKCRRMSRQQWKDFSNMLLRIIMSGSELLEHKLDRTQFIALANEHLNFSCNEEETRQIYLKLESAKEMFIRYTKNQKKTYVSEDSIPEMEPTSTKLLEVKEEIPDSPTSQYNDNVVDCNHIDAEIGTMNPDVSDALETQNDSYNLSYSNSPSTGVPMQNTPMFSSFSDTSSLFLNLSMFVNEPKLVANLQPVTEQAPPPNLGEHRAQPMKYTQRQALFTTFVMNQVCSPGKTFRGVRQRHREKWVAEIKLPKNGTRVWLGTFHIAREAAFAYDTTTYMLRGDNAHLNFPHMKNKLKANSTSGSIVALLKAKMQTVSKQVANTKANDVELSNSATIGGPIEVSAMMGPDIGEGVQLSRMPSLDMDLIWDGLLVSDA
nr:ethylene-responsive transcription factor ERF062-like [Tanacetum cinerariifolium]